ncbi:MAG: T9SS type A sorting domain-containing protein [Flavipsychrobacter sp.]
MRTFKLLSILLLFSGTLSAQSRLVAYYKTIAPASSSKSVDTGVYIYNFNNRTIDKPDTLIKRKYSLNQYFLGGKTMYTYDKNWNNVKTISTFAAIFSNTLYNLDAEYSTYDNNNNNTSRINLVWNDKTNQWDSATRKTRTFDANGNWTTYLFEQQDANNKLKKEFRYSNTYNNNKKITLGIREKWDGATASFDSNQRHTYTYDANNNLDTTFVEDYKNNKWEPYSRYTYVYNSSHQVTSKMVEFFKQNGDTSRKVTIYTYDAQGDLDTVYHKHNDFNPATLTDHVKEVHIYTSKNPLVKNVIEYAYDRTTKSFKNGLKIYTSYNSYNQLTMKVTKHWDTIANDWRFNGLRGDSARYYYEAVWPLSVNTAKEHKIKTTVYPNPSSGHFINVQVMEHNGQPYTIVISTVLGRVIAQYEVEDGAALKTIATDQLPSGQYLLSIVTRTGKASQLFSIER